MTERRRAPLVAIEGIDGTGKTTLQRALARAWRSKRIRVLELQEPTRGPTGLRARRLSRRDAWTAAVAFTEDRRCQRDRIERALRRGTVVLLDRSFYSTLAYQATSLPPRRRREVERMQVDAARVPDRVILLDLPVGVSEARVYGRGRPREPTERRAVLERASNAYRRMARRPGWILLDGRLTPEQLMKQLHRRLTPWVVRRAVGRRERT